MIRPCMHVLHQPCITTGQQKRLSLRGGACAGMQQQQLRGGPAQSVGAAGMPHVSSSRRPLPDQHLQQQPSGVPDPGHLALYPNLGMSLPQNGSQPHAGGPPYSNMGNANGPPPYMMNNGMQNRHLGAAGPGQTVPPGQPLGLPGPQVSAQLLT